ncbi:MAG: YcxB family protein [Chryseobacterium sp.]|nr:YcxB family protein [Chryseobacterium sp.]
MLIIALLLLISFILWQFEGFELSNPYFNLLLAFAILIILPIFNYFGFRKSFSSNKRLQENIIYEIDEDKIKMIGESFDSEIDWSGIYKIVEYKNWFLLFQNSNIANFLPKKFLTGNQIREFRSLILKNNVKSRLKKT